MRRSNAARVDGSGPSGNDEAIMVRKGSKVLTSPYFATSRVVEAVEADSGNGFGGEESAKKLKSEAKKKPSEKRKRKPRKKQNMREKLLIAASQKWECFGKGCLKKSNREDRLLPAAFEIDHIVALTNNGKDEIANKQALCPNCHRAKTTFDLDSELFEKFENKSKYMPGGPLYASADEFVSAKLDKWYHLPNEFY